MSSQSDQEITNHPAVQEFVRKTLYKVAGIFVTAFIGQLIIMAAGAFLWGIKMETRAATIEQRVAAVEKRSDEDRLETKGFRDQFGRLNDSVQQMIGKLDLYIREDKSSKGK